MYRINPGEFKHPIEIISFKAYVNEDNIPISIDEVILKTKARILNISGKEKILGDGVSSINSKRFYIRYKNISISAKDKIKYAGKLYNITYVSDVEEKHKYLEIVAELIE